jgi:hypothetical protein
MTRDAALAKVLEFSASQAHEIWCAMQLIATNKSLEELPRPVAQIAMDLNRFLVAWKVIAEKALVHERLVGKRKRRGFWIR